MYRHLTRELRRNVTKYKEQNLQTITTDYRNEFTAHEWIARHLGLRVYITDTYCLWQKGAVDNTNKLIRQYIQKGRI